jgi:hypothetical protein
MTQILETKGWQMGPQYRDCVMCTFFGLDWNFFIIFYGILFSM